MRSSTSSSEAGRSRNAAPALVAFFASCATALVGLVGLTEWLIRTEVIPHDTRAAHIQLLRNANAPDAAFGDSHVARGFHATDGFVNLAFPSENIEDMSAKVKSYFDAHTPERVILQADPHLLAPYRVYAGRNLQSDQANFYLLLERHRVRALAYWAAFLRGGGRLTSKVTITASGSLLSEGDLSAVPERKRMFDAQLRRVRHRVVESAAVERTLVEYGALLDWLAAQGAKLCLVSYPVSNDYSDAMGATGHETEVEFFAAQAARVGARFVDARRAITERRLFRDVDHLNSLGALAFSPRLLNACFGVGAVGQTPVHLPSPAGSGQRVKN